MQPGHSAPTHPAGSEPLHQGNINLERPTGWARLFARKPIGCFDSESSLHGNKEMRRSFGPISLTLLGVGTIVGLGIYVVTGQVAANVTGPAIVLSFLIAGFACGCAALCFAELAAMMPVAGGSAYVYTHLALGELPAWIVAWCIIAEYLFATAAVGSGWSAYTLSALASAGIHFPDALAAAPIREAVDGLEFSGKLFNLPAALLVAAAGLVVMSGTRSVARLGSVIVALKLTVVLLLIIFGLAHSHVANWTPFIPSEQWVDGQRRYGWHGVFAGAGMIFFTYLGFDTVSTAGREARDPQRTLPIAILGSITISTILYIGVSLALTGLVSYRMLEAAAPVDAALAAAGTAVAWLRPIVTLSAIVGLASAVLALVYGLSRVLFATAGDGLLPILFTRLSVRSRVPTAGVVVASGAAAMLAGFLPIDVLGQLISVGTLIALCVVCGTHAYLRKSYPALPRPFSVPAWPLIASIGFAACLYLLVMIGTAAMIRISIWIAIGMTIYLAYGFRSRHGWSFRVPKS
jgi:APA family basic amino acid/polyamine antiporter